MTHKSVKVMHHSFIQTLPYVVGRGSGLLLEDLWCLGHPSGHRSRSKETQCGGRGDIKEREEGRGERDNKMK